MRSEPFSWRIEMLIALAGLALAAFAAYAVYLHHPA
jgi:hypothetical protein